MRLALAILAIVWLMFAAGCSSAARPAGATAYTNAGFRFSVSYDATQLSAAVDHDISGTDMQVRLPGLGWLVADQLAFIIRGKHVPSGSPEAELEVIASRGKHPLKTPTLAAFQRESYMKTLIAKGLEGLVFTTPRAAVLGGLRGFRYDSSNRAGSWRIENYTAVRDGYVYNLNLVLPPKTPEALESSLRAALSSFRVTQ